MDSSHHDTSVSASVSQFKSDYGFVKTVISLGTSSPYKMTHRFLRGTRTWESWFYSKGPREKFDHDFQCKQILRLLHRLHVDKVEFRPLKWSDVYYNTRAVAIELVKRCEGIYTMPKRVFHPLKRKPVNKGLSRRSRLRAERYAARREAGFVPPGRLQRRGAVRQQRSEGPRYVAPAARPRVVGQTCRECRRPFTRVYTSAVAHPFQNIGGEVVSIGYENRQLLDPDSYYHIWMAAESGLWTGEQLASYFHKVRELPDPQNRIVDGPRFVERSVLTSHRIKRSQHRWEVCHPIRCWCTSGVKRHRAKGLKLSLG